MNAPLAAVNQRSFELTTSPRWWDTETECNLVLAVPSEEPDLWEEYLDGAQRSYQKHGVERALSVEQIRGGHDTAMFFVALDENDRVVAGVRAKGPLLSADDSHAVVEWAGRPGLDTVRKMIDDRVPFGILEMKSAWVTDAPARSRSLTKVLARSGFHAMALMDAQFCMATAGAYVLDRWRSSGGVVASNVPPTPYPDERYETKMMWWDRRTFAEHADPKQASKIFQETLALTNSPYKRTVERARYGSG